MTTQYNDTPHTSNAATQVDPWSPLKLAEDQPAKWEDFPGEGVTFHDAAERIIAADDEDGERQDIGISRLDTWAFGWTVDGVAALATRPAPGRDHREVPLRSHAFTQLCSRVGAPTPYIKKLPAKLQAAALNWGIKEEASQNGNLLRLASGEARALLSDRYAPFDNRLVIEVLEDTLRKAGMLHDVRVRSVAYGKTASMRMTLPGDDLVIENPTKVGDVVEIGLDLLNGEIGNRSVSISPVTWRLVCLNGMRSAQKLGTTRLNHIGDPERLKEAFRDGVPAALASAQGLGDTMQKSIDVMLDDVLGELGALSAFGFGKGDARDVAADVLAERQVALPEDTDEWVDAFARAGQVTAWDVGNAITHVAQTRETDRRLEMEEAAHAYLLRRTR